jgi:hypothetical protein
MMGGQTADARLKSSGIDVRKGAAIAAPCNDFFYPKKSDPEYGDLAHPREHDPLDDAMVEDMIERFPPSSTICSFGISALPRRAARIDCL